jgi:hypothetical protein
LSLFEISVVFKITNRCGEMIFERCFTVSQPAF